MRLLLDTHTLLWAMQGGRTLPISARRIIDDDRNDLHFSAVNIHEIAVKRAARRRAMPEFRADEVWQFAIAGGLREVLVTSQHAIAVETLAISHPDPFDRLLLAQAQVEGLQLLTHDERLGAFDNRTIVF